MKIVLEDLSKVYKRNVILRKINFAFENAHCYGISGSNGSGKSTLLKLISGYLTPTKGKVVYMKGETLVERDAFSKHVAFSAPYIDLLEDLSIKELFEFQKDFTPMVGPQTAQDFVELMNHSQIKINKKIGSFSSGMKHRVNLALALLSDKPILLLDEPSSFLDMQGIEWFNALLDKYKEDKTILVASNEKKDFELCRQVLKISHGVLQSNA